MHVSFVPLAQGVSLKSRCIVVVVQVFSSISSSEFLRVLRFHNKAVVNRAAKESVSRVLVKTCPACTTPLWQPS